MFQLCVAFVNTVTTIVLRQATCNSYKNKRLKGEQQQDFHGVGKLVTDCSRAHWQKSANDSGVTGQGAEPLHEISKRNTGINTFAV